MSGFQHLGQHLSFVISYPTACVTTSTCVALFLSPSFYSNLSGDQGGCQPSGTAHVRPDRRPLRGHDKAMRVMLNHHLLLLPSSRNTSHYSLELTVSSIPTFRASRSFTPHSRRVLIENYKAADHVIAALLPRGNHKLI